MSGAGEEILIEVIPGETLIAVTQGGLLTELFIHRLGEESQEGNIYLGRVIRVVPSIEAAFVELGLDEPGFLDASDARLEQGGGAKISDMLREGDKVLVQVLSDPREDKGAKLTRRINPPEAGAAELEEKQKKMRPPALLSGGQDPIRRVLLERDLNQLHGLSINDSRTLRNLRPFWEGELNLPGDLLHHHKGHPGLFASQDIETQIDEALMPRVGLSSGGSIYIEATEALIAIDVNSGAVATPGSQEDKAIQTNLEAAREILRQMRLRNLAGQLMVDFLPMKRKANREKLLDLMRNGAKEDQERTHVLGFTRLGLLEMTRQRRGRSLAGQLLANGDGNPLKSPTSVAFGILRALLSEAHQQVGGRGLRVEADREVIGVLQNGLAGALQETGSRLGQKVELKSFEGRAADSFDIKPKGGEG